MQYGAITSQIDVAQVALYTFWLFFLGLIFYLRREDRREGYPLLYEGKDTYTAEGIRALPSPKTFLLAGGGRQISPRLEPVEAVNAYRSARFASAPLVPKGNPLLAGVGAGAYAHRADVPDHTFDDALPKIVPLRAAPGFFIATEDPNPVGMAVVAADGVGVGTVVDAWIDRSEVVIRYLEAELAGGRRVLLPMNFIDIDGAGRRIVVQPLFSGQFADIPALRTPDQVTLLEEEKITAYFGAGLRFAAPSRSEPLL